MTYDEALAFWYGRTDFERRAPDAGELKLDRMRELLRRLGDPHERLRTVHVAGSKGKGSTCAMLASVLRCAGYRTGLFTSPHLVDVRERIQIDGELIGRDEVAALMVEIRPAVEALEAEGQPPTFFEVSTALGFLHFLRRGCDIAVIEVGLGGRFDSTNVITPLVSAITSISLDHTQILGDTVEQIAFEKAGIIKPGVPIVSGVTHPVPRLAIAKVAVDRGSLLVQLGVDLHVCKVIPMTNPPPPSLFDVELAPTVVRTPHREWWFHCKLRGWHQWANSAL